MGGSGAEECRCKMSRARALSFHQLMTVTSGGERPSALRFAQCYWAGGGAGEGPAGVCETCVSLAHVVSIGCGLRGHVHISGQCGKGSECLRNLERNGVGSGPYSLALPAQMMLLGGCQAQLNTHGGAPCDKALGCAVRVLINWLCTLQRPHVLRTCAMSFDRVTVDACVLLVKRNQGVSMGMHC